MRLDYVFYAVAIIFFIATLSAVAYSYSVEQQQVWVVTTAVIGLAFIGLGYTQRPKTTAPPATAKVPAPPPPQQQQQELALASTLPSKPAVTEPAKVEEAKPIAVQPPVNELTEVKGIGEKRAAQLRALGINTIEDLVKTSPENLASKLKISPKITSKWIESAKEIRQKP